MNKTELINVVAAEAEVTKKDAEAVIAATLNAITEALKAGDKVQLIGFGNFEVKEVAAREGRNPKTGETIEIAACKKPSFTAAKALKDAGAKNIYLYISHCENSVFEGDMYKSDLIKKIFTVHPLFDKHINDKKIAIIE